jgi:hypothetical protein
MVGGNLVATASTGNITDSGALVIEGVTTLAAGSGNNITLDHISNDFQSAVKITSGNNVTLVDAGAIDLGASTVSGTYAITATSGGDITDSGVLAITSGATFTVANGRSIILDQSSTFSSTVAFAASSGTIASVTLSDSDAFDLGALTTTGDLNVPAGGAVTDSGTLVIPDTATISASGQTVNLDGSLNNFGTAAITGANVTIRDTNAIILGASTVSGTYSVTAGGAITDSGALAITGVTTIAAGSGNNITLDHTSNNFQGAVQITSGNNVTLVDAGAIDLGASTVSGTYAVTATSGGDITDSGVFATVKVDAPVIANTPLSVMSPPDVAVTA